MDSILHPFRMLWYGVEGAILVSETTGKTDLVLRCWACSTVQQGIRAVASGALPNQGFRPSRETNVQSASALLRS